MTYLLLSREPRTIKLSSIKATVSVIVSPVIKHVKQYLFTFHLT